MWTCLLSTRPGRFLARTARGDVSPAAGNLSTWTWLGPGNVDGRTRGLVIDPGAPSVMYAAGVAGGVWKTTEGSTSWHPLDDQMANPAVSALAMASSTVLYAGTGEGFFNIDYVRGAGSSRPPTRVPPGLGSRARPAPTSTTSTTSS